MEENNIQKIEVPEPNPKKNSTILIVIIILLLLSLLGLTYYTFFVRDNNKVKDNDNKPIVEDNNEKPKEDNNKPIVEDNNEKPAEVNTYNIKVDEKASEGKQIIVTLNNDISNKIYLKGESYLTYENHIISYKKEKPFIAYVYNLKDFTLEKTLLNAFYITEKKFNGNIFYMIEDDIGRGGCCATTSLLDSNFNTIIDNNKFPENYKKFTENEQGYFNVYFDMINNLIAIKLDNIYVYDLKGNLVNTIKEKNIIGLSDNYFLIKENNDLIIKDYHNKTIKKIVTLLEGERVANAYYLPKIGIENNNFYVIITNDNQENCNRKKYIYSNDTDSISQEEVEYCYD